MKFKNKIYIQYKYLLIYLCLILQTEAARPFSSGSTRSNFGSGIGSYGSTSNSLSSIGNTRSNFGLGTKNLGSTNSILSSIGNTKSNFGPGTGSYGSTGSILSSIGNPTSNFGSGSTRRIESSIGTTNYNTGLSSQSNIPFISIADGKTALRTGSNTPQTYPSTNSGFSSFYKSSDLSLPHGSTNPVISIADGKKNFASGSKVATNLNTPTKQPAYNPYFNAGPKVQASRNIDNPLIQQTAFGVGNQLPTAPNYDANTLPKQSVYNPTFNTVPKTQVPNSNDEKLLPKPPAYNTFYKTGTNESTNFTTIKQPPYNPSFHEMNTNQYFPAANFGLNQQPPNNAGHTSNVKNITNNINKSIFQRMFPTTTAVQIPPIGHFNNYNFTKNATHTSNTNFSTTPMDYIYSFPHLNALNLEHNNKAQNNKIPSKNGYKRAKIVHNYLKGNKAMLSHTSSILGLKGYTVGAVEQLNHLKTQQELNRALKNHKSNHVRNQIPVIIAVVVIITIVGGIIIFLKVKK